MRGSQETARSGSHAANGWICRSLSHSAGPQGALSARLHRTDRRRQLRSSEGPQQGTGPVQVGRRSWRSTRHSLLGLQRTRVEDKHKGGGQACEARRSHISWLWQEGGREGRVVKRQVSMWRGHRVKKCPADTCWKAGGGASTGQKCPGERAPTCTNAGLPADGLGQSLRDGGLGPGLEGA